MSAEHKPWWTARKFQMFLFWVGSSVAGSLVAINFGIAEGIISAYWIGSGIAMLGVFNAHGRADAAALELPPAEKHGKGCGCH